MEASGSAVGQSQLVLTVSDEVQLDSISLAFSEGESQDALNQTLPYPQALVSKSATLDPSQTLKVFAAAASSTCWLPLHRVTALFMQPEGTFVQHLGGTHVHICRDSFICAGPISCRSS